MKIVVLCGGLSTERKISFSSGTKVCQALRSRGHQAVLVDMFNGLEDMGEEVLAKPEVLFEQLPPLSPVVFDGKAPDLEEVRRQRKYQSPSLFGRGVIDICSKADVVFIALHGLNGEDGRVQAAFDLLGIRYTGSGYLGAAMGMDKIITKQMVRPAGINTPDWHAYHHVTEADIPRILSENHTPCVVKTPTGGSSVGVYVIKETDDLQESGLNGKKGWKTADAGRMENKEASPHQTAQATAHPGEGRQQLEAALKNVLHYGSDVLIEQYIEGREFTNAVLEGQALPCVEIVPKSGGYDYNNKYVAGATEEICPGRLAPELARKMGQMAVTVHETLGLRTYSRSDFMIDKDNRIWFLEVNTLPGMTPTSLVPQEAAAVGISYEDLCEKIVEDALR